MGLPFPKSLTIAFIAITLIANISSAGEIMGEDTWEGRAKSFGELAVRTPDRIDNFISDGISAIANTGEDGQEELRYTYMSLFFAFLGFIAIFLFFQKLTGWLIGLFKAPSSEQRTSVLTFIITSILIYMVTGLTWVRTVFSLA